MVTLPRGHAPEDPNANPARVVGLAALAEFSGDKRAVGMAGLPAEEDQMIPVGFQLFGHEHCGNMRFSAAKHSFGSKNS